jgi:hypothetical protein|tara:strand:- start:758 stop:880 length:123 start_codon:yes stop_codon:yes gene_type:complete
MKRGTYKPKPKNEKALKNFLKEKPKKNERSERHTISRCSK